MDKTWIFEKDTLSESYLKGVGAFIQFSMANASGNDRKIFCPCRQCININRKTVDNVKRDILLHGFSSHYTNWIFHGEKIQPTRESTGPIETEYNDAHEENDDNSPMDELPELLEEVREARNSRSSVDHDSDDFERLMKDAQKEAYPGCQKYSVLLYVVTLLHIKVMCHWSNKSFNMLLEFLKDLLPEGNNVPSTLYGARSMLSGIGMKYEKIDACKHDCALFWKENQDMDDCPVCGESRWKFTKNNGKKVPQKVLWYFPLQPRLQRLFMSSKSASNMRWHAEKRIKEDGVMRHPADSPAWKDFDAQFPDFARDPRNVRLGLATDGFTPFGDMSNAYSIWPVILLAYNMSAFEFMKQEYFMLTLLISGPRSPGKDIDVYLRPLIDDLKELWNNGIQTYDAHNGEVFQMRAAILWTVNDFPAYGNLSGWSTSGYKACPRCFDETSSIRLRDKIGFIGHRRFLPPKHPWRRQRNAFDGTVEKRLKPKEWTGSEILQRLQSLEHLFDKPGKHPNKKKRKLDPILGNWRKLTIFNELPYWPFLKLPYNIDFMHVEKGVSESLAGTLFGIEGKSKDTVKAREDLRDLGIRCELHMQDDGRKPNACYTLSPADRKSFCDFLRSVKFPDGYASNISRCVKDGKIHGLKSHDYHVFLQRLVGIGVRGFLCKEVNEALVELSHFFRDLCSKTLKITDIDRLEENIPLILCKLEKIFPPAFFDVMIHLVIHLPHEARLGGPVHARWMYPFERYIRSLKRHVRNKARPEGSIAEGYIATESLTFISKYLHGVETKFNRRVRNEDNAWFDFVDIETDPLVQDKIDDMLQTAFRRWKNTMHVAYNESKNAGHNAIEDCPFDWFEEGVWKVMCDSFEEPKYKRRSDINKDNRSKLPYPHTSGSQPFHVRYYRMAEAERSHVKNWRDCHTKKNGCMVNDKAELLAEEMDTKKRLRYEAGEPVIEEDILADTLGKNTSYRKGMGYGFLPSQPTKRAYFRNSEAMKNAREQLQEQQSQLVRQQTQIENQQVTIEQQTAKIEEQTFMIEEANSEINTLNSELGILKEKQMKLEANMEKMLAIFDCM